MTEVEGVRPYDFREQWLSLYGVRGLDMLHDEDICRASFVELRRTSLERPLRNNPLCYDANGVFYLQQAEEGNPQLRRMGIDHFATRWPEEYNILRDRWYLAVAESVSREEWKELWDPSFHEKPSFFSKPSTCWLDRSRLEEAAQVNIPDLGAIENVFKDRVFEVHRVPAQIDGRGILQLLEY